jgi:hypothetical protein
MRILAPLVPMLLGGELRRAHHDRDRHDVSWSVPAGYFAPAGL